MIKILKSVFVIVAVAAVAIGATGAYFSDSETSNGNTFTAGSLDLEVDGGNLNVIKFTVTDMMPGDSETGSYNLSNVGSIDGFLDLENISVSSDDNGIVDPESDAGDATDGVGNGELDGLLNLKVYADNDSSGTFTAGDVVIYDGVASSIASSYDTSYALNSAASQKVVVEASWPSSAGDDTAQSDSMNLDMTFELGQTAGQ